MNKRLHMTSGLFSWCSFVFVFLVLPCVAVAQTVPGVGFQTISISDPVNGGDMPGYLFYPSAGLDSVTWVGPYALAAAANLPALSGSKPLVVISHGSGGSMLGHHDLATYLARHGFLVATLEHPKDNYRDVSGNGKAPVMGGRPIQVSALISTLLKDPRWKDLIDEDRIGVAGFSNGGYTGLLLLGAVPRFDRLLDYCQRYPEDEDICSLVFSSPELALVKEGLNALQRNYTKWGEPGDARVKSAFVMAPQSIVFDSTGLAAIDRPVFLYYSQNDLVLLPQENAARIAEMIMPLVDIKVIPGAGHYVFLAPCSPVLSGEVPNICTDPPGVDRTKVHAQINADALAFFRETLSGSADDQ